MVHGSAGSTEYGTDKQLVVAGHGRHATSSSRKILEAARALPRIHRRSSATPIARAPIRFTAEEVGADHFRSSAVFLTAAHPKQTEGSDIHNGTSIDQIYAQKFGQDTPLPSIQLCIENLDSSGHLRLQLQLRLHGHDQLVVADDAAADDARSAAGVRGAVRHRRQSAGSRQPQRVNRSILDGITPATSRGCSAIWIANDREPAERLSREHPRDRAADPEDRRLQHSRTARARAAGGADRRAGLLGRARQADVRSAGPGLRRRRHARLDLQAEPRHQQPRVPRERLQTPFHSASHHGEHAGDHRGSGQDQPLPPDDAGLFPREAARTRPTATATCWITRWCSTAARWATATSTATGACRWCCSARQRAAQGQPARARRRTRRRKPTSC